jgi:hypothetical protein
MQTLTTVVDARNRELPFAEAPNYVNFYLIPDGGSVPMPAYAKFIGIVPTESSAWFRMGATDVQAYIPLADIDNGISPLFVPQGDKLFARIGDYTHFAVFSSDSVVVEFWS